MGAEITSKSKKKILKFLLDDWEKIVVVPWGWCVASEKQKLPNDRQGENAFSRHEKRRRVYFKPATDVRAAISAQNLVRDFTALTPCPEFIIFKLLSFVSRSSATTINWHQDRGLNKDDLVSDQPALQKIMARNLWFYIKLRFYWWRHMMRHKCFF